jgi:hypothetical protein
MLAILKMTLNHTTLKSFEWLPSVANREAFKDEYRRMQTDANQIFTERYQNQLTII